MRKFTYFYSLLLTALFLLPWSGVKADELTVGDETTSSKYVPLYGYYADTQGNKSQVLYLASDLSAISGGEITGLTFYCTSDAVAWGSATFDVKMANVGNTATLTSTALTPDFTTVYSGSVSVTGGVLSITFTTNFSFSGEENLLLEFALKNSSSFSDANDASFYGTSVSGAAYNSKASYSSPAVVNVRPKTTFTYTPGGPIACAKPTDLDYEDISGSSAKKIKWTTSAASSNLQFKAGTADWVTVENVTSPYTLSVLPMTTYQVKVQAVCGGTDGQSSYTSPISFTTPCGAYTLPFTEDFSAANDCWTKVDCEFGSIVSGGTFMFAYNSAPPQYLISPELAVSVNDVKVEFDYKARGSWNETFHVGYSTTTSDVSAFTWDDEISYSSTTYTKYSKIFSADVTFVAIKYTANDQYGLYIDNFSVSEYIAPTCFAPTALSCDSKTAGTATLSWTKGNESDDAWVVEYSTASNFSGSTEVPAATNSSFVLSGLSAQTTYYVRVKTKCGETEFSDPSDAINFTTDCNAQAIPFEEDFSSAIPCWTLVDCTSGTEAGGGIFRFQNNTTPPQYLISPELEASAKALQVAFDYKVMAAMYPESFKVGYSTTTNAISAFTWGDELTGLTNTDYTNYVEPLPAGVTYVAIQYTANNKAVLFIDNFSVSEAPSCSKPTSVSDATSITPEGATFTWSAGGSETQYDYCVVAKNAAADGWVTLGENVRTVTITGKNANTSYDFYVRSNCGGDQSDAVKKSFTTAAVNAPTGVTVGSISTTGATASWTAAANITTYQYCVVEKNATATWDQSVNDVTVALSGLTANTEYDFYVRSYYAANGATAEAAKVSFRTKCSTFVVSSSASYEEHFESGIPACWDATEIVNPYSQGNRWESNNAGKEGKCLRFNNYYVNQVLATEPIRLTADANLTFYYKNTQGATFQVMISVGGADRVNLGEALGTATDWTLREIDLTAYTGSTVQLFFYNEYKTSYNSFLWLDELTIEAWPACRKPASDPVASGVTANEATLTWTAGGANTDYQFSLVESGESPVWDEANVVSALTKSFDNLQSSTTYDFYVRTYCDAGDDNQSEARMVSFHTGCGAVTLPFEENFNSLSADAIPDCWNNDEGTSSDYYKWKAVTYSGHNTTTCVRFNSSTNAADATNVLATPVIQLNEGNLLTFWTKNPTGGDFKVQIQAEGEARADLLTGLTGITDWTLKYVAIPASYNNKKVQLFFCATSNDGDANAYIFLDDVRIARGEIFEDVVDAANTSRLNELVSAAETLDVITTRPMQFNGNYNTLCLPFNLTADQLANADCPLNNCEFKVFDYAEIDNGELVISITGASSVVAGMPYFFRYLGTAGNDHRAVLYKDVTITAATAGNKTDVTYPVSYKGVFQTETLLAEDDGTDATHNNFFLGANNTIYWPLANYTANAFRAYFHIDPNEVTGLKKGMPLRLAESQQTTTTIDQIPGNNVQCVKVLENGYIVIIRNGVKYNVQGQVISK